MPGGLNVPPKITRKKGKKKKVQVAKSQASTLPSIVPKLKLE